MGEQYQFHIENDELLSEAERAFDLSARQASMPKHIPAPVSNEPVRRSLLPSISSLFSFGGTNQRG